MAMASRFMKVLAYEPQEDMFSMLKRNTSRFANVHAINKALGWVKEGKVRMGLRLANKHQTARIVGDGGDTETTTIDAECGGKDVSFIKLDLEGFDYHALRGGAQTILRCQPTVLIEEKNGLSEHFGVPTGEARAWLESIGMVVVKRYPIDVLMGWA